MDQRANVFDIRAGRSTTSGEACSSFSSQSHFSKARTGAKTAASTLYRSTKLRLTAFMTEGAGLAAVVAAAAKTRGIGCKGDLVRSFLIPSHFACWRVDKNCPPKHYPHRSVVVKSRYFSICRKPIRNAAILLSMV